MRFLVLGCNGMAGHNISLYLKEQSHDVFGFDRRKSILMRLSKKLLTTEYVQEQLKAEEEYRQMFLLSEIRRGTK